jgi:hypothetical protein
MISGAHGSFSMPDRALAALNRDRSTLLSRQAASPGLASYLAAFAAKRNRMRVLVSGRLCGLG